MEMKLPGRRSRHDRRPRGLRAVAFGMLLSFALSGTALSQQILVSGTVRAPSGTPLPGVSVRVQGADTHTQTRSDGRYSIDAPSNGTLIFAQVGRKEVSEPINGRTTIDVSMQPIAFLEQVVVTAYGTERRADITGAVASANLEAVDRQSSSSVLQRLGAAVPGVTVAASGSPGARSTVRIRGITSFQNNDPLYIVDGVPVQDSYINFLNPDDITSIQVLKDASAASIYGSRASNGVVIIETTRKGEVGGTRATVSLRTGISNPVNGYDKFLLTNSLDYFKVEKASYENAGLPVPTNIYGDPNNPAVPQYIYAEKADTNQWGQPINVDPSSYSFPYSLIMPGSPGTNWWKAVFGTGHVSDLNLNITGGQQDHRYGVSMNFFDQKGTAIYNEFKRGNVRANTDFTRGKLNFGENALLSMEQHFGGISDDPGGYAEDGILGKNIMMQPVIPVYDIKGNFAGGKATSLGNQSNPVKEAFWAKDNVVRNNRAFGNVFAGYTPIDALNIRSSLGFNVGLGSYSGYSPPFPEAAEATFTNGINENTNQFTEWTWSNTARYTRAFGSHNLSWLVGQEANGAKSRYLSGSMANLVNFDVNDRYIQDALGAADTKNVSSSGSQSALLSMFTKADYNYNEKYIASFTVRRDGSSRLAPGHQWGTFPAFGLGWRLTKEPFLEGNHIFSDVLLRYGWGITGNQLIPPGRIVAQFGGGTGETFYDINGSQTSIEPGYHETSLGNPNLKWEEDRSSNVGADVTLFDGAANLVIDVYKRTSNDLLFNPGLPATAGLAAPPIVNIGKMQNTGFDFSLGHNSATWSINFNGSHYSNKILSINGDQKSFFGPIPFNRFGYDAINEVGHPIGSFYGLVADGLYKDDADAAPFASQGAKAGRIKFKDLNGDGAITNDDRTIIGSPHPKFTGGLNLGYRRGDWDVNATVFGSYGNKIFEEQMEWYVFREFSTNVRKDLYDNSWTPTNTNAKYPRLDASDSWSSQLSSFYVKDGSYTRLQNLQIGYNIPPRYARYVQNARVYVQAENLFTITGYDGLDPSLPAANLYGSVGDVRDQYLGIDRGVYPSSRTFSIGLTTSF